MILWSPYPPLYSSLFSHAPTCSYDSAWNAGTCCSSFEHSLEPLWSCLWVRAWWQFRIVSDLNLLFWLHLILPDSINSTNCSFLDIYNYQRSNQPSEDNTLIYPKFELSLFIFYFWRSMKSSMHIIFVIWAKDRNAVTAMGRKENLVDSKWQGKPLGKPGNAWYAIPKGLQGFSPTGKNRHAWTW